MGSAAKRSSRAESGSLGFGNPHVHASIRLPNEASWLSIAREVGLELLVGLGWLGAIALLIDRVIEGGRRDG